MTKGVWTKVLTGTSHTGSVTPAALFADFPVALLSREGSGAAFSGCCRAPSLSRHRQAAIAGLITSWTHILCYPTFILLALVGCPGPRAIRQRINQQGAICYYSCQPRQTGAGPAVIFPAPARKHWPELRTCRIAAPRSSISAQSFAIQPKNGRLYGSHERGREEPGGSEGALLVSCRANWQECQRLEPYPISAISAFLRGVAS